MRVGWTRFGVMLVGSALLAGCTSGGGAGPQPSAGAVAVSAVAGDWTLVRYSVKGEERELADDAPGTLTFGPGSTIAADDSVNYRTSRYAIRGRTLRIGSVTSTLVAAAPGSPAMATVHAIGVVFPGSDEKRAITIGLRDGRLVVSSGRAQVEFRR